MWFGVAAFRSKGLRVIPSTMFTWALLSLARWKDRKVLSIDWKAEGPWYRETLARLLDLVATGELQPAVAARVPLADAAKAHELLQRGGHRGKVVLVTDALDAYAAQQDERRRAAS